jgi:hypothetical protein
MTTVELFLSDLSEEGVQKFVDAGVFNSNWDVMPVTILEFEKGENDE